MVHFNCDKCGYYRLGESYRRTICPYCGSVHTENFNEMKKKHKEIIDKFILDPPEQGKC